MILQFDKLPSKAQIIESLTGPHETRLKGRHQEGIVMNEGQYMTSQEMLESPLASGLQNKSPTSSTCSRDIHAVAYLIGEET